MRICFYANMSGHANWREMFDKVEFYRIDIQLLRELGHEVVLAGSPRSLDRRADLFYCWWWGHAPFPVALGKLLRRPVVVTGAFDYATCREELPGICYLDRPLWQKIVMRSILKLADANLFISGHEHQEVVQNLQVRNPVLAPLAINTGIYRPAATRGASDYFFAVSWTSTTNAIRKGMRPSIEAFARIAPEFPGVRFVFAGKAGDHQEALEALAARLGVADRVVFAGMISEEEKLRHYQECIAYVQPTLYEGFGHAIGEALACGAPVITSPRGAVPEVVGPFGELVEPKDVDGLAQAMRRVLASAPDPDRQWAQHAWIENEFSLRTRRNRLERLIADLSGPAAA